MTGRADARAGSSSDSETKAPESYTAGFQHGKASRGDLIAELHKLRKINSALMEQVERSLDYQGSAYSLFKTATHLEAQVRRRTQELTSTLASLEQSNLELQRAKDQAERANRSKTRFLAAASHDVLQPLNAALLLMSSLQIVQTSREGTRLCEQVERSLDTMNTLLRTLLFMSRLDAGEVQPEWQTVSVSELFDSLASDFQPVACARSLQLRVRSRGLYVRSDPTMLRRVLQNIVANAIRYTDKGGVLITAVRVNARVHIRVADTGRGIAQEEFDDIFLEFHRGRSAGSRSNGISDETGSAAGLGLGLAIVQRMVRRLGHEITLNSRVGRGSCFQLSLSAADAASISPPKPVPPARRLAPLRSGLAGTRILVIENDIVVMQAMEQLLRQWGCDSRLASSTPESMHAIADGWVPDLILADQQLDHGNLGTTTVKRLRERLDPQLPAVLITADSSEQLVRLTRSAGIEMMSKPVKPAELRALVAHLRDRSRKGD